MTQENVYNLLKKKEEWMRAKDISKILKLTPGSVTTSLNKLLKYDEILKKDLNEEIVPKKKFKAFQWRIK